MSLNTVGGCQATSPTAQLLLMSEQELEDLMLAICRELTVRRILKNYRRFPGDDPDPPDVPPSQPGLAMSSRRRVLIQEFLNCLPDDQQHCRVVDRSA